MTRVFLTGFEAFDGRAVNGSWLAVSQLAELLANDWIAVAQIPVEWGAPARIVARLCAEHRPRAIVALGEGKAGCFHIETLACNRRGRRPDNRGELPTVESIQADGPEFRRATAPRLTLRNALVAEGVPVLQSIDAGGYLCEEMLYALEQAAEDHPLLKLVVFVHLPPYGTTLCYKGEARVCDEALLLDFAKTLYRQLPLPGVD